MLDHLFLFAHEEVATQHTGHLSRTTKSYIGLLLIAPDRSKNMQKFPMSSIICQTFVSIHPNSWQQSKRFERFWHQSFASINTLLILLKYLLLTIFLKGGSNHSIRSHWDKGDQLTIVKQYPLECEKYEFRTHKGRTF